MSGVDVTLYSTLGVRRNASLASIKRAYRKQCLVCHPDRGGDADAFRAVQIAFEVLSDAQRRKHYDATGQYATKPDDTNTLIATTLANLLAATLSELVKDGVQPKHRDIVAAMRQKLLASKKTLKEREDGALASIEVWKDLASRFEVEAGAANILAGAALQQVENAERVLAQVRKFLELAIAAEEWLKRYKFKVEPVPVMRGYTGGYAATTTGIWGAS